MLEKIDCYQAPVVYLNGPRESLSQSFAAYGANVDWVDPETIDRSSACVFLAAADLSTANPRSVAVELRKTCPFATLVLVTCPDPQNLPHLAGLGVDIIVPMQDGRADLATSMHDLLTGDPVVRATQRLERASTMHPVVKNAVVTALRTFPPVHTAAAIGRSIGVAPNRLSEAFRDSGALSGRRLPDLLWVVALRHLVTLLREGDSIKAGCAQLCLTPVAVRRAARRYFGCTPSQLRACPENIDEWIVTFIEEAIAIRARHGRQYR